MEISVVIPSRVRSERASGASLSPLRATLTSMVHQTLARDQYEVILVDDDSGCDLKSEIAAWNLSGDFQLRTFRNSTRRGCAGAMNVGLEQARGRIVLLGTDANLLHPRCLEEHVSAHAATLEPSFMCGLGKTMMHTVFFKDVATGELLELDDLMRAMFASVGISDIYRLARTWGFDRWIITPDDVRDHFDRLSYIATEPRGFQDMHAEIERGGDLSWLCVRLGNNSAPLAVFQKIGHLDDTLSPTGASSDLDLGLKLRQWGVPIMMVRGAESIHLLHRYDVEALLEQDAALRRLAEKWRCVEVSRVKEYFTMGLDRSLDRYRALLQS